MTNKFSGFLVNRLFTLTDQFDNSPDSDEKSSKFNRCASGIGLKWLRSSFQTSFSCEIPSNRLCSMERLGRQLEIPPLARHFAF